MSRSGRLFRKSAAYVSSLSLILAPIGGPVAHAQNVLPQGGKVVGGSASISQPAASALSITQSSQRAIINWNSFSVGAPNSVNFYQPNSSSAALNRVLGSTPSTIAGQLNANGQIFLVNPNGIAITSSGTVTVGGGFVASTLDIGNADFMAGNLNFRGNGASAGVSNQGIIRTAPGGFVGLLGGTVSNSGTINVPLGKVGLGSGEQVTLDLNGDGFMQVAIPTNAITANGKSLVDVAGKIQASGGRIELSTATVAQTIRDAVNVSGSVSATSMVGHNGSITLGGGPGGNVKISGNLDVSGTDSAGKILTNGVNVKLSGAKVTAQSQQGTGGTIIVTAANDIALNGSSLNASGATGGGAVRVGGDFHGLGTIGTAATTTVDATSTIKSDALLNGPGGTVVLWSGQLTTFSGLISAKGGTQGGNGGSVEVSSKGVLAYRGVTDLSAVKGQIGTLLLDPYNVIISSAADAGGSLSLGTYTPGANDSVLNTTTLTTALASANVIVTTGGAGSPGAQAGDITVASNVSWSSANSLTLSAYRNIAVNANITNSGGADVNIRADNSGIGVGTVTFGAGKFVSTAGVVSIFYNPSVNPAGSVVNGTSYVSPTENYSGNVIGGGTLTAYMLVNTVYDLQNVQNNLAGTYALGTNIDASATSGWNAGAGFVPIGNATTPFTGSLNGQNNTITNLVINRPTNSVAGDDTGLFGTILGGAIQNIGLISATVAGENHVGALAGTNDSGSIRNSYVSGGTVSGNSWIGGLVGNNIGTIANSYATNAVSGVGTNQQVIGGLVGNNAGIVMQSYATGPVTVSSAGSSDVGGLVGSNSSGTITLSYATGTVNGGADAFWIGGLAGFNNGTVTNSYATGAVSASASTSGSQGVGGLVGNNESAGIITQSHATGAVNGGGDGYFVGGLVGQNHGGSIANSYATGAVSASTLTFGSAYIGGLVGYNWGGMIDQSYATGPVSGGGQVGGLVGTNEPTGPNAIITGSYATGAVSGDVSVGGLVGRNFGGTITQSHALGPVNGGDQAGGLVGTNDNGGTIAQSYATGAVSGNLVGGLVGDNQGSITLSYATGPVTGTAGTTWVGGLVGVNEAGGNIGQSYATGAVSGYQEVGGLAGRNDTGSTITQSYATGTVTGAAGSAWVGGLVGRNGADIQNSYATGTVTGSQYVGGLVGINNEGGSITQSYAVGGVSGTSYVGGLVGINAPFSGLASITQSYATGPVSGDSFVGGLVGYNGYNNIGVASISLSYATGAVSGTNWIGGLVGYNGSNAGVANITQSYATGTVNGFNWVGGLVGYNDIGGSIAQTYATGAVVGAGDYVGGLVGFNIASITNSYASGAVTGPYSNETGGLVGFNQSGGSVTLSYWDTDSGMTAGVGANAGTFNASGLTTNQFMTAASFSWNFGTSPIGAANNCSGACWVIVDANGTLNNVGGAAGATRPFLLSEYSTSVVNSHELQLVALNLGANYTLANNINLGPALANVGGKFPGMWGLLGFVPIGNNATPFTGTFNGQNYAISNLVINRPTSSPNGDYTGLFGKISGAGAMIQNVNLIGGSVTGANYTGALVGYNFDGNIQYAANIGTTVTGVIYVGGLVGFNDPGSVTNSSATGAVSGRDNVGGLIGFNDVGSVVQQSNAAGAVSGVTNVGGLIGNNNQGTISQSFATGAVSGVSNVGGLVGNNSGVIYNSSATGEPSGANNVGALVGYNTGIIVNDSIAVGTVNGASAVNPIIVVGFLNGSANPITSYDNSSENSDSKDQQANNKNKPKKCSAAAISGGINQNGSAVIFNGVGSGC